MTVKKTQRAARLNIWYFFFYHFIIASSENLPIHEDKTKGVYVKGLLEVYVGSTDEVYEVMKRGSNNRVVAYTSTFIIVFPFLHLLKQITTH